jgi:hypothetical protein
VDLLSVLRFIPIGAFDDATVRTIGRAFDAACKELKDTGLVHEVMIKRIIAAARRGERSVTRLRDAAPTCDRHPRRNTTSCPILNLCPVTIALRWAQPIPRYTREGTVPWARQ